MIKKKDDINMVNGAQVIMKCILTNGPISKNQIQQITNYSWGHISQVTEKFLQENYIEMCGVEPTSGRSRALYDIKKDDNYYIGLDLNVRRVRAVVINMKGDTIYDDRRDWKRAEYKEVMESVYCVIDGILERYHDKKILGIGVALQGILNKEKDVSVRIGGVQNWENVPLKRLLEERYHRRIVLVHDTNCLMKSELVLGQLRNCNEENIILVHHIYGVGIGMGIMLNGQFYEGEQGIAGEIGYTIIDVTEEKGLEILEQHMDKRLGFEEFQPKMEQIAKSVATVNSLFNPGVIVLHMQEDTFKDEIAKMTETYLRKYSYNKDVRFVISKLPKNAKALGSAMIVIDQQIESSL